MKPADLVVPVLLFTLAGCADDSTRETPAGEAFIYDSGSCDVAAELPVESWT